MEMHAAEESVLPTWRCAEGYWATVCRPKMKVAALSTHG